MLRPHSTLMVYESKFFPRQRVSPLPYSGGREEREGKPEGDAGEAPGITI